MSHRVVWGAIVAVVSVVGCGGKGGPDHGERNDALDETKDQSTLGATSPGPSSPGTSADSTSPVTAPISGSSSDDANVTQTPHTSTSADASVQSDSGLTSDVDETVDVTDFPTTDAPDATSATDPSDSGSDSVSTGKACGARAGDSCQANEYCAYVPGQWCGQADAEATCKLRPESCTADYNPVCGCDGKTYSNTCVAASAGAGVFDDGECEGSTPEPADCETVQCFRAITCAESCSSEVVQAGCCPCPEGLIDTFVECTDQAPEQ